MLKNNKILFIFLTVLILFFSLCTLSLGASNTYIDPNYDYLYDFNMTEKNDEVIALEDSLKNDDRVKSGEYYYFIAYDSGRWSYQAFLIKKSAIDNTLYITFDYWHANGPESFLITFMKQESYTDGDFIRYSSADKVVSKEIEGYYCFGISADFDTENNCYNFYPFATNYVGKIVRKCSNGTEKVFMNAPTQMATILMGAEPEKIMTEILKILPMILVVVVSLVGLRKALQMLFKLLRQS